MRQSEEKWVEFPERISQSVDDPRYAKYLRKLAALFRHGHPAASAMRIFWRHPKAWRYQVQIVRVFILNALMRGYWRRIRYRRKTGITPPFLFAISPTNRCNLACEGCYANGNSPTAELTWAEVDDVIRQARRLGIYFVVITGGEPFMWPGLMELVEQYSDMMFLIYTNGTHITSDIASRLARTANAAPALSLEGGERETDERRGRGVYRRIEEAFRVLREARAMFGFSATATSRNFHVIACDSFRQQQIDRGCAFGWLFHYAPVGANADLELMISPEQRMEFLGRVRQWRRQGAIFIADFWNDGPLVGGCIAGGRRYLHVNASGDIEPCVFLKHATHNIRQHSLEAALSSPLFTRIRERQSSHDNLLQPCFLVDHPEEWRDIVRATNARSTDGASDMLLEESVRVLAARSAEYGRISRAVWESLGPEDVWTLDRWPALEGLAPDEGNPPKAKNASGAVHKQRG